MNKIKEKILNLIKALPEDTPLEDFEELIDFLYVKKQILKVLEDFKQGRSYSLEEMKIISNKWKLKSQKRQKDN